MAISLELDAQDEQLLKSYAKDNNISLSELLRNAALEKIERMEDEYDLALYKEALEEYKKNPISYSHTEVCRMLGVE